METLLELSVFKLWFLLMVILVARYMVVAGLPYFWLYIIKKEEYQSLKIQKAHPNRKQIFQEIKYSLVTFCIYSSGIWLFVYWLKNGYTRNYADINEYGLVYFVVSILLMVVLHDTYSYWVHRLMHHKIIFKYTHLLHHKFKNPSTWGAFAFHPLESILTMGIIPIIIFTVPWHNWALVVFITWMIFYDTFVHLGYDIKQLKLFKFQNTPLDHDVHHRNSKYNFGLYFTFWDRLMGTYKYKLD
ncbi:sterol desaturase family protein [Tamlana fucoidanivorans]|uniref:Sterol desaturase family protein n=1 Tax=Allotamlana fucoidanivorans TaxID=2583814 RepID=A0A5C4SL41_9FLAO|nr:sterol desaturase family protein [Tamlana fucoidanivorans]TNJ44678.1 sterol desaturase family protein [Tamlana fucoidanivorans]